MPSIIGQYISPACVVIHNIRHSNDTQMLFWQGASSHSKTTLHEAVAEARADVVKVLIDAGADIEEKDSHGRSPLLFACMRGCLDIVKILVQAGAELCVPDHGRSFLFPAAANGHTETVRYLVGLGQVDRKLNSALNMAAVRKHVGVVQVLIDAGADIKKTDPKGRSPLFYACVGGCLDIVKMLLQVGAEQSGTDCDGRTCFTVATEEGHTEIVRYLVGLGQVGVDHLNAAFPVAVRRRHAGVVQVLIDAGADIEERDIDGRSPLFLASRQGLRDIMTMLLDAGAEQPCDTDNSVPLPPVANAIPEPRRRDIQC